ncbi:GNAT family N-acetyltransferase [Roseobacteraceae bacterium S113]
MTQHPLDAHGNPVGADLTTQLPRPFPRPTKHVGQWGFLEPLELRHATDLHDAFRSDPAGFTYLPDTPYQSIDEVEALCTHGAASHDPQWYAICDPEGRALGHATYLRIDPTHGVAEVGWIHYGAQLQRTPLATEAMFLMMRYILGTLGYRRYEWKCDALNAPSRAAARRLGFTFEGIFRQATTYKGRNRDTAWFSILDHEWPAREEEFTRWLDPSNFDGTGQQRTRLTQGA